MTPSEWDSIVKKVTDLWGPSPKWASARVSVYDYARNMNYVKTVQVVDAMFLDGRLASPSPSEVISSSRIAGALDAAPVDDCDHTTWAIVAYHDDGSASAGVCAACRLERTWGPGEIRTAGAERDAPQTGSNRTTPVPA